MTLYSPIESANLKGAYTIRELDFSRKNLAEAVEELQENVAGDIEREVEGSTAEFLNGMLRVEASRQVGADSYERTLPQMAFCDGFLSHEPGFAFSGVGLPPPVRGRFRDFKEPIGLGVASNFPSICQNDLFAPEGKRLPDDRIPIHRQNLLVVP